jgi:hypothetical protein
MAVILVMRLYKYCKEENPMKCDRRDSLAISSETLADALEHHRIEQLGPLASSTPTIGEPLQLGWTGALSLRGGGITSGGVHKQNHAPALGDISSVKVETLNGCGV